MHQTSILHPPSPTSGGLYTELVAHEWTLYLWRDCSIYSRGQTTQDAGWADTPQPGCNTSVAQGEDFPSLLMLPDCTHINFRSCPRKTNQTNGHFHYHRKQTLSSQWQSINCQLVYSNASAGVLKAALNLARKAMWKNTVQQSTPILKTPCPIMFPPSQLSQQLLTMKAVLVKAHQSVFLPVQNKHTATFLSTLLQTESFPLTPALAHAEVQ